MDNLVFSYIDNSNLIGTDEIDSFISKNVCSLEKVQSEESQYRDSLGWLDVDEWGSDKWIEKYKELAGRIQKDADAFVVIGIGGSNQAARAVYEAIGSKNGIELFWIGNNISADSVYKTLVKLDNKKNIYIDCIAKNFETLEPGVGFRIMRDYLSKRYGDSYKSHVFVTFSENTYAWKLAQEQGYTALPFPSDIGGRYTALSPVGLFPLAVAGLDIRKMVDGAKNIRSELFEENGRDNKALQYATIRTLLHERGKYVELLAYFEPRFFRFAKWWKQLFGESEGKEDKGLLPMDVQYSEDLHSLGQFVQDGTPMLFETFLDVGKQDSSYVLKEDIDDGFSYLNGKDLWQINKAAYKATLNAHSRRFPTLIINIPEINEYYFGQLFYFFQFACYISCNITGVNPFDQNGVEAYKCDMFKLLGK